MEYFTDMELFFLYSRHLDNPCSTMINGEKHTIRPFWERLALESLERMTNPWAKSLLEKKIRGCL